MWYKQNFFKYAVGTILFLIIIFLLGKVDYFLNPFKIFVATLFFPFFISGMFYYLLRPAVHQLQKLRVPRTLSIVIIVIMFTIIVVFAGIYSGSMVINQLTQIIVDSPKLIGAIMERLSDVSFTSKFSSVPLDILQEKILTLSQNIFDNLPGSIIGFISTLTNIATVLLLVPFILFYLLKDDHLFASHLLKLVPDKHRDNGEEILEDIDRTLSNYIICQFIVGLFIGVLMYIGYMFIGLNYAFVLALFAAITSIIPIVGAFIGILPALLAGLPGGPFVLLKIFIIMAIVQQIQGNLISPLVMGKSLDIHPLTYIVVFLVAASIYGFIGMLIAVPVYAVLKVTLVNLYQMYRLRKLS